MKSRVRLDIIIVVALLSVLGLVFMLGNSGSTEKEFSILELGEMSAGEFGDRSFQIVPEMLAVIYLAFAETEEERIYDSLAEVSADEALETLYLERVGAMAGGGLAEADQELHSMDLLGFTSQQNGSTFDMNVTWRVVGTVGHAEHLHVRGNTYSANLSIGSVDEAWRITSFDLTDVDRSDAGELEPGE